MLLLCMAEQLCLCAQAGVQSKHIEIRQTACRVKENCEQCFAIAAWLTVTCVAAATPGLIASSTFAQAYAAALASQATTNVNAAALAIAQSALRAPFIGPLLMFAYLYVS